MMYYDLHNGDAIETLITLPDNSVDSIVTDPPAGIEFMGKEWDSFAEKRIAGARTQSDAWDTGRDSPYGRNPTPVYRGKGGKSLLPFQDFIAEVFAHALRVLKPGGHALVWAIPRTSHHTAMGLERAGFEIRDVIFHLFGTGFPKSLNLGGGFGTALKPGAENWILCRKPLIGTVASNVTTFGTGALNIDGCRIATTDNLNGGAYSGGERPNSAMGCTGEVGGTSSMLEAGGGRLDPSQYKQPEGRWPANVTFDPEAAAMLGEPSRFFYVAKPNRTERDAGCEDLPLKSGGEATDRVDGSAGTNSPRAGAGRTGGVRNAHPTVKSIELMRWLCRLVTPPKGIVLDPFMGSGSTGCGAMVEGLRFIGIEREEEYFEIAQRRIEHWRERWAKTPSRQAVDVTENKP